MKMQDEKVSGIKLAYIGGGSRGWAWGFMKDLARDSQMEGVVYLYDIDRPAAENNKIIGEKISALPQAVSHWRYEVSDTLEQALEQADFVVISILPGTFEEMRADVHLPEEYGIYQSVGDTVGPGGLIRALRTVPMYWTIGYAIQKCCPRAWVINYTNPMSVCVGTLYSVFPEIRAFGCCHEVFGTQKLLSHMLRVQCGIPNVPREEIKVNVLGINHFTWFDKVSYQGTDLLPLYRTFAGRYYENGFAEGADRNWMNDSFVCARRVKFDLFLRYGLVAAAGDRHLAEFVPKWYLKDPQTVQDWMFGLTSVDWRVQDLHARLERARCLACGQEIPELEDSGEEGHLLMKALLGLGDMVSNVNLPNRGQISNLPMGAVVETNAVFGANGISPVEAGSLPGDVLGLVMPHAINQQNIVRAALEGDKKLACNIFLNDPQLAKLSSQEGEELFNRMLAATRTYLPKEFYSETKERV